MSESKNASAVLTEELLGEAATKGFEIGDEAKASIEGLRAGPEAVETVDEPVEEVSSEVDTRTPSEQIVDDAREAVEEKIVEMPSFSFVSDDELATFEEEEAEQTIAEIRECIEDVDEDDPEYEDNEDMDDLKRRLYKAEKALAYQKEIRVKQERKSWESEASEKYPLANVSSISAQSRNGFMKAAALSHNAVYSHVKPHLDELETLKKGVVAQAKAEGRAEAAEAWGKPSVGPSSTAVDQGAFNSELDTARQEARRTGSIEKVLAVYRKFNKGV